MNPDQSPELKAALTEFARVEAELEASIKRIRDALAVQHENKTNKTTQISTTTDNNQLPSETGHGGKTD